MKLPFIGRQIALQRRTKGLTLSQLAAKAEIGRSTLAALESGKLPELGLERVSRLCSALDLVLEVRPLHLGMPIMEHRHLTAAAGRDLTKAVIDDIITGGDVKAWRALVAAMRADKTRRVALRVAQVARARSSQEVKAKAFANLLTRLDRNSATRSR